ncbi:MAG: hypothetical protein P1U38_15280 [Aeromicrobium sp.]|uniref:hypothetical protein n=1 Tax=Aeromicrobium sp. TaxID=1871063 RepID=UPI00261FFAA6|nr:hypothetical protein [Aeromicrobium sp.]MDF1706130.1 hypothetical protein [Aeromicrobium sp.]
MTSTTAVARGTGATNLAGRAAAVLGAASAAVHVAMSGGLAQEVGGWLMLALALVCVACVRSLWRGPQLETWFMVSVCSAVMIMMHGPVSGSGEATSAAGHGAHDHHLQMVAGTVHGSSLMGVAVLVASVELVLAVVMVIRTWWLGRVVD